MWTLLEKKVRELNYIFSCGSGERKKEERVREKFVTIRRFYRITCTKFYVQYIVPFMFYEFTALFLLLIIKTTLEFLPSFPLYTPFSLPNHTNPSTSSTYTFFLSLSYSLSFSLWVFSKEKKTSWLTWTERGRRKSMSYYVYVCSQAYLAVVALKLYIMIQCIHLLFQPTLFFDKRR